MALQSLLNLASYAYFILVVASGRAAAHGSLSCPRARTSRSRRPCARGEVLCAEPGRSHPCPDLCRAAREGNSRTPSMYADEKSDEAVVPRKHRTKEGNFRRRSWREGPHPRGTADRRPWFGH